MADEPLARPTRLLPRHKRRVPTLWDIINFAGRSSPGGILYTREDVKTALLLVLDDDVLRTTLRRHARRRMTSAGWDRELIGIILDELPCPVYEQESIPDYVRSRAKLTADWLRRNPYLS